jgi:stage II sporulation protein AA (anti-sigma F factor antagonist)
MDSFTELTKDGIVQAETLGELMVVSFRRGRIREEREILRVLTELGEFVEGRAGACVLVNMENIEYLSSAGLGALVGLLKRSRKGEGRLKLCCLKPSILELFEVMRLTKIFELYETQDEAVKAFAS